jgi:hypothetical protein
LPGSPASSRAGFTAWPASPGGRPHRVAGFTGPPVILGRMVALAYGSTDSRCRPNGRIGLHSSTPSCVHPCSCPGSVAVIHSRPLSTGPPAGAAGYRHSEAHAIHLALDRRSAGRPPSPAPQQREFPGRSSHGFQRPDPRSPRPARAGSPDRRSRSTEPDQDKPSGADCPERVLYVCRRKCLVTCARTRRRRSRRSRRYRLRLAGDPRERRAAIRPTAQTLATGPPGC